MKRVAAELYVTPRKMLTLILSASAALHARLYMQAHCKEADQAFEAALSQLFLKPDPDVCSDCGEPTVN